MRVPVRREEQTALVAEYLARGGEIHRIPPPNPTVASDVLQYLQDLHVDVHPVRDEVGNTIHYVLNGKRIDLNELVALANRRRKRSRRPPFQLENYTR